MLPSYAFTTSSSSVHMITLTYTPACFFCRVLRRSSYEPSVGLPSVITIMIRSLLQPDCVYCSTARMSGVLPLGDAHRQTASRSLGLVIHTVAGPLSPGRFELRKVSSKP